MMTIERMVALLCLVLAVVACGGSDEASSGRDLAAGTGCFSCHTDEDTNVAPTWNGLAGSTVTLDDGTTVVADADYLRRSIVDPHAEIVEGYGRTMPTFRLSDDEVDRLVEYIQELAE